ncbi:hypothetical protein E2C01_016373 [Portunus trituberculatus]|uniref:Uncharacterized protein n=1 Tax=Portunus trituberculatus TaxID=210409 RepID=A0A5B7DQF0_PORTR|nr:hypothetical protein [Portunus trituberculatus]
MSHQHSQSGHYHTLICMWCVNYVLPAPCLMLATQASLRSVVYHSSGPRENCQTVPPTHHHLLPSGEAVGRRETVRTYFTLVKYLFDYGFHLTTQAIQ